MSSSGITPINSGPLTIRTYLGNSINNTYVLGEYDYPVSSNRILTISSGGQLVPTNNVAVSSITVSSITSIVTTISTAYLSTVFSSGSAINFENQVNINTNPAGGISFLVNGSTVFTEPGAQSTSQNATLTVWGLPTAAPVNEQITNTTTYTITSSISTVNFQLIGAGGNSTFSNPLISQIDQPGYGAYISGRLLVKQNDKLQFTIGQQGNAGVGSGGTSLVYFSSIGGGNFVSSLVCIAGAGGGNGYVPNLISSSSGGGHGGGANGSIKVTNIDFIASGTQGQDGLTLINGVLVSDTDGGKGGQTNAGGAGGAGNPAGAPNDGLAGSTINTTTLITTGGLVLGGKGGLNTRTGGWGGGGYSGGGGGGAGATTSAGGGGGSTYIAVSTLSNILSNVICLGGQFFADNSSGGAFGGGFGSPNNPGYAEFDGYAPNATFYTNGDIECRVLKYTVLDPPIDAIGGSSALWAKYPAIAEVHLNENRIVECGGIEVDSGGILVDAGGINVTGNSIFTNNLNASTLNTSTLSMTSGQIQGVSSISGTNIILNGQVSTLQQLTVVSGGVNVNDFSIFNSTLCASTLCTSTLSMTSGQIQGVSSISGTNIILNGQVSTLQSLTVVSGGLTVTGDSLFNNNLNTSTLITSTISMTSGQIQGVSSISGTTIYLNGNTSTIGNGSITGTLTTNGNTTVNGTLATNTLSMTSGSITGVNSLSMTGSGAISNVVTINGSAYPPSGAANQLLGSQTYTAAGPTAYTIGTIAGGATGILAVTITAVAGGGGGGGGGPSGAFTTGPGGGGGGAGQAITITTYCDSTTTGTVVVGAGGAGGVAGSSGGNGGDTYVTFNNGTANIYCYGGRGGVGGVAGGNGATGGDGAFAGGGGGQRIFGGGGASGITYASPFIPPVQAPPTGFGGDGVSSGGFAGGAGGVGSDNGSGNFCGGGGGGGASLLSTGGAGGTNGATTFPTLILPASPGALGSGGGGGAGNRYAFPIGPDVQPGAAGGNGRVVIQVYKY